MTAAIVVAFLLSSSILVLFYNQEDDDKEISLIARVNTEGSGIYIDDDYEAEQFIRLNTDGSVYKDENGKITYYAEFWEGKIFGTPGSTSIQHVQLRGIVEGMGLDFKPYIEGSTDTSPGCNAVYYIDSITNAAAFENTPVAIGGIAWQPQYEALLQSTKRPCNSMMTTADFDPGHTCCVIGASHEFITSNYDVTVRFLAGYIMAVDWINDALSDKSSEKYAELVQLAMERTGINNRTVVENALDSVVYTYGADGVGDTEEAPLTSLENAISSLVGGLNLSEKVKRQGFSSDHEFAQRFVNDGYLSDALDYKRNESGYSKTTVTVATIAGDIHQLAVHLGVQQGFFDLYGIDVKLSSAANGAGVGTSLQNGEATFGFLGAPPITVAVVNGALIQS